MDGMLGLQIRFILFSSLSISLTLNPWSIITVTGKKRKAGAGASADDAAAAAALQSLAHEPSPSKRVSR